MSPRPKKPKPVELAPDLLTTTSPNVRWMTKTEPAPPAAFTPGPTSADRSMSDAAFVERYATPAELKSFRAAVQHRRAADMNTDKWRRLPSGAKIPASHVLAVCGKCGFTIWIDPEQAGGQCLKCNFRNATAGGHMRPATAAETARWIDAEGRRHIAWLADAPRRAGELADFNRRRIQDAGR